MVPAASAAFASVEPRTTRSPSVNPVITVMLVAERAADLIRQHC
jgi:choline dehydrogenase-like flavoprotein